MSATKFANEITDALRDADGRIPLPIDPVRIARELGVNVYQTDLPNGTSGMIARLHPGGDVDMILNSNHAPVRQRFTCAHELGHYRDIMSQDPTGERTFVKKRAALAACGTNRDEIFANQFAAALLMPEREVRELHGLGHSAVSLSRIFGVSAQAATLRLVNLRLEEA